MEGLKLVFLTGILISDQTMKAVQDFVREGGLCISLAALAPMKFKGKTGRIADGSGQWLFVNDFLSEEVRKSVEPFMGKTDEISYRIGKQKLVVKRGKDGNSISIYLQNKMNTEISESEQVW